MEANEAQELQENAEHGEHERTLRPVAFTMSVLAVLVAVTTVLGHRTHTDAVLNQAKASDKWNEYQAVKIRSSDLTAAQKLRSLFTLTDKDKISKAEKDAADDAEHQKKWAEDLPNLKKEAEEFEAEVRLAEHRADFYDLGEALLEIGLVVSSVTLLTRSRIYWFLGIGASLIGVVSVIWGLLIK
jgi:Domain of unknown function (DUF4337)